MIIRVLNDHQYDVPDTELDRLNRLDDVLQSAVDHADQAAFDRALADLLAAVRGIGSPVPDDTIVTSDLVLPGDGSSLEEVSALLGDEGLIPG
ncbi:MAG TPA: hypothetical protein VK028_01865 [Micromonosporaceae bacterium]|nr:hypothetical protein [Micromonosporaceae bacterium]